MSSSIISVVGSRSITKAWEDDIYEVLDKVVDEQANLYDKVIIMSGGAKGVDTYAERYAGFLGLEFVLIPALWDKYGKRAGYIRNQALALADVVVAFWDGSSKGTTSTIQLATERGKDVRVYSPFADGQLRLVTPSFSVPQA